MNHDGGYLDGDAPSIATQGETAPTVVHGAAPTPPPDGVLGRLINGKYKVQKFLAKGGMGRVYAGIDQESEQEVAIKILAVDATDALFRRRFFNEAAMSASLHHPNVVEVMDFGVDDTDGTCFIVMELLQGETLASMVKREKRLEVAKALRIVRQVCAALSAAHAEGFVHRDLKPSNLFLLPREWQEPLVKVLDFGLAKRLEADNNLTQTGSFLGSPTYMSPEQITGAELTVASDLYNLGVLLYRMVVGRPPFIGDVASAVLVDHATKPPPPFSEVAPDLQDRPALEWVVMRCLAKSPSQRFSSADELDRAVEACLRYELGSSSFLDMAFEDGELRISEDRANRLTPAPAPSRSVARRPLTWAVALAGVGLGSMFAAMGLVVLVVYLLRGGL